MVLLLLIFIVVPIAELYVIYKVGDAIGIVWTLVLLAADSILGTMLMRTQGRAVWRRFQEAMQAGRMPHREVLDGVLVIFGGAFLITPGFLTDIIGLMFLLPPTRSLVRRWLVRGAGRRFAFFVAGGRDDERRARARNEWDVEGTARDEPPTPRDEPPRLGR